MDFRWWVAGGIEALSVLAGVRFDRLFRELDAVVASWRDGLPIAREMFGPEVPFGQPHWAGISYGHVNCLGSELIFPEGSEVAHTPVYGSLAEGVRALKQDVDFARAGLFPFYLDLWDKLKRAFPEHNLPFAGFGSEGPVTTAWLLRGHDFFMDIYDDPPLAKEYLALVAGSVVKYNKLTRRINGQPELSEAGAGVCDDGAAMIPPKLWPEFVLPALERHFTQLTSGRRSAHIEDRRVDHLRYLDALRIGDYDPSVSPKLSPALIRKHCGVSFTWRLNEGDLAALTADGTRRWVLNAAAEGAPAVRTGIWRNNCTARAAENIRAFTATAQEVQRHLADGRPPEQLLESVQP